MVAWLKIVNYSKVVLGRRGRRTGQVRQVAAHPLRHLHHHPRHLPIAHLRHLRIHIIRGNTRGQKYIFHFGIFFFSQTKSVTIGFCLKERGS